MVTATAKRIAEHCGISRPAVSLILNNKGDRYSESTRRRVLAAAEELGYRPNTNARSLAKGEISSLGLLTSTVGSRSAVATIQQGIQDRMTDLNLHLTVAQLPDQKLTDAGFVPRILREFAVSGFMISYTHEVPHKLEELIERFQIPSVWMNSRRDFNCIYPDDRTAGRRATEHLIRLGHRRIAYAAFQHSEHFSHADRFAGYMDAMHDAGLAPIDSRAMRFVTPQENAAFGRSLLDVDQRPTAFVTYEQSCAGHLLIAALRLGLDVPRDLSLVAISERQVLTGGITLCTMRIPFAQLGRTAVDMVLSQIKQRKTSLPSLKVQHEWVEGNSCRRI